MPTVRVKPGEFVEPSLASSAYTCPHCGVLSPVAWSVLYYGNSEQSGNLPPGIVAAKRATPDLSLGLCAHCSSPTVWLGQLYPPNQQTGLMLYPTDAPGPGPHPDMPATVAADYEEARSIVARSPRGAIALLRLAAETLLRELGGDTGRLNDLIGSMVAEGLSVQVQQALDALRVTGNNAVHPGQIVTDDPAVATSLFGLLNLVVEQQITQPRSVQAVFDALPEAAREAIARRDSPAPGS